MRRAALGVLAALLGLAACASVPSPLAAVSALATGPNGLAGVALVVRRAGEVCLAIGAGTAEFGPDGLTPLRAFRPDTKVRVASVSKLAVALLADAEAAQGRLDLDAPVTDVFPTLSDTADGEPVTLRRLLAHTAGIRDGEVYWQAHPGDIRDLLPGQTVGQGGFGYANVNYGLAATVLEARLGARFDRLMIDRLLASLGLTAGFNWSGVPEAERLGGGTLYRRERGRWAVAVDNAAQRARQPAAVLLEPDADVDTYRFGQNGSLFSPQGGLRASAGDLAVLAEAVGRLSADSTALVPQFEAADPADPATEGGFYRRFGTGIHLLLAEQVPGAALGEAPLRGHSGEAYGLVSGAWFAPDVDLAIGFVATGLSEADLARDAGGLTRVEAVMLAAAARGCGPTRSPSAQGP